jgi:hypothetical protein
LIDTNSITEFGHTPPVSLEWTLGKTRPYPEISWSAEGVVVIRVAMAIAGGHEQTESNPPERKWFYGGVALSRALLRQNSK